MARRAPCGKAPPTWIGGCGFCTGFGPGDHRIEIDEFAVIFRSLLRPDFLHRLDRFAHALEAGRIDGAVVFHFVLVPAVADAEQEPSSTHLVDRRDEFGGLDNVALLNERYAGAEFDSPGHLTC